MFRENIIPLRGVGVDWSGDKEKERLRDHEKYARDFMEFQLVGSPDFNEFASFLCLRKAKKATEATKHRERLKSKK
jgi:hypothetical protein